MTKLDDFKKLRY